jgi:hypothetical protein
MRAAVRPDEKARPSWVRRGTVAGALLVAAVLLLLSGCAPPPAVTPGAGSVPPIESVTASGAVEPSVPETSAVPSDPETPTPGPKPRAAFSVSRVRADSQAIEDFGPRPVGSAAEKRAADYVAGRLRDMGYEVAIEKFPVPGGTSRNVTARIAGDDPRVLVLGAHLDSKSTTPGGNDDAVGCAIVLEMARTFAKERPPVSIEFTLFGSEEYNDGTPRDHHRGSRYHVRHMTKAQRARTVGMISIDVVGYGGRLYTRTMKIGPMTMSDYLLRRAKALGIGLTYNKDPGPTGWSDHEPYEKAGIPAVWLERLQDPQYHKMGDTTAHLQTSALKIAGRLILDAVRSMDAAEIAALGGVSGE